MYLAELLHANLPEAESHHEFLQFGAFGTYTPDLSDMRQFNAFGNNDKVRAFWKQKLLRIAAKPAAVYIETAHMLAKAGLMENIALLADKAEVFVVLLRRDIVKIVSSMLSNYDFFNKGNMWLWYLDPEYPRKITDPTHLIPFGRMGGILWYVIEMRARAEYYRLLLADAPWIHFIDADIDRLNDRQEVAHLLEQIGYSRAPDEIVMPPPQNTLRRDLLAPADAEALQRLVEHTNFDAKGLAQRFIDSGRRLAEFIQSPVVCV